MRDLANLRRRFALPPGPPSRPPAAAPAIRRSRAPWTQAIAQRLAPQPVRAVACPRPAGAEFIARELRTFSMWTPVDEEGRQTCIPCRGTGMAPDVKVDRDCLNCDGEGYRWPDPGPGF